MEPQYKSNYCTLQFIRKLHNAVHVISMQSNRAAITLSGSAWIQHQISGHIPFRPESGTSLNARFCSINYTSVCKFAKSTVQGTVDCTFIYVVQC